MHTRSTERWVHDHTFGQEASKPGEGRTLVVIAITAAMMVVEVAAGLAFQSMALLADGLHMASHASALTVSAFAYYYTRRHARDARFNFGTGKFNSLGAFASAVLLVGFALIMAGESVKRFFQPLSIQFNQAIFVAILGLAVNGLCFLILRGAEDHGHSRHSEHGHHRDLNLRAAVLHVLADALTSLLAIVALMAGKYFGWSWLDPFMGLVGAALVTRWSWGLLRSSSQVLLDKRPPDKVERTIRQTIEGQDDNRITDLHVWSVGPGVFAVEISLVSSSPRDPEHYRSLLPEDMGLVHINVEVHRCPSPESHQ